MSSITWLDVPPEVRCTIYKYFFQSVQIEIHGEHRIRSKHRIEQSHKNTSILLTCKSVNLEADPYFLSESEFFIKECICWRKDPETRPRRLKEIQYLTFNTTASQDHWISLWYDLIWINDDAASTMSNIKELKISQTCCLEELENLMWLFDCIKGRFRHFEMLVDASELGLGEVYCKIVVDEKHKITITGEKDNINEIEALLIEACDSITDANITLNEIDCECEHDDLSGNEDDDDNEESYDNAVYVSIGP